MDEKLMTFLIEKGLRSIYEAEHQILEGLHVMSAQAYSSDLQKAFQRHEKETRSQIRRLEEAGHYLLIDFKKNEGLKKALGKGKELIKEIAHLGTGKGHVIPTLIEENKATLERFQNADSALIDIALAGGGTQIEQAEIAAYQILCYLAEKLNEPEALALLQQNLEEEKQTLFLLTEITEQELLRKPKRGQKTVGAAN